MLFLKLKLEDQGPNWNFKKAKPFHLFVVQMV